MNNILIVDDSKFIRAILEDTIQSNLCIPINITLAASFKETEDIILQNSDFKLAILDVNLPDAPNGEVIDLVLEKGIPVVVLTGGIKEANKKIISNKDIVEYVTKSNPDTIQYIASVTKRILKNYDEHVLIVDDSKTSRAFTKLHLENLNINVIEAGSAKEAIDALENSEVYISLVLTDYEMPDMNGMDLTLKLRQHYSKDQLSILAVSGSESVDIATKFLHYGANDFIKKPYTYEELAVRVNINLELIDLFRENKENANKDFLTGLNNRRYFFENAKSKISKDSSKNMTVALAMIDIDFFKTINDTYGHDYGDIALKEVSTILNKYLDKNDITARFGGEEFCILMSRASLKEITESLENIRTAFETNSITLDDISFSYTVSIGVSYGVSSIDNMIKMSDQALYLAKETGRNKVIIDSL